MATNSVRKTIVQNGEPFVAEPGGRKPPQCALAIDARIENDAELPGPQIPASSARKAAIPATWTEVIQDPQLWAELRLLLVDED